MTSEQDRPERPARRIEGWRLAVMAAVALIPAIGTYALVHLHLDAQLSDFVPAYINDQTGYWHYVLSFSEHGLDTGYYSPDEHPAALEFFRYDLVGPYYPAIYGSLAWIAGWDLSTSIFFNMVFVGGALALFVYAARLDRVQAALVVLLALLFAPLLLYVPTSLQESFHQAVAIMLALVFSALISRGGSYPNGFKIAGVAFITLVSLTRFGWALLLVPYLLLAYPPRNKRGLAANLAGSAGLIAAILVLFAASTSPGGNSILNTLRDLPDRPGHTLSTLASDSAENLRDLFDPAVTDSADVPAAIDAVAVQAWLIAAFALVALLIGTGALTRLRGFVSPEDRTARREWLFHAYNLGSIVIASVVLYLPLGYYRVLSAHLLLSLLVLVYFRRVVPVAVVLACGAVMVPSTLNLYEGWKSNFSFDTAELEAEGERVARHIRFQDDAPSPWCNTLLLAVQYYDYRVTMIPAGIGVSYLFKEDFTTIDQPLKSRYVLLDSAEAVPPSIKPALQPAAQFSFGRLYTNPASPCDES